MSGILDRMAKRALGVLPGIRPVAAPPFAQQGWTGLESNLDVDAPAPRAPRASPDREIAPPSKRPVLANPSSPQPERRETARDPEPEHPARVDQDMAERTASGEVRETPAVTAEPVEAPPRAAAHPRRPQDSVEVIEVLRAEAAEQAPLPDRRRQAAAPDAPHGPSSPAREAQPLPPAEQKTEIHISIGSIELRASRGEVKPTPPRFRPRVTLDEFLRRKPEAHS